MNQDSATTITLLAIGAFAIDRVVTALMFLLSFVHLAPMPELAANDAARVKSERRKKLMYYCLASAFAIVALATFRNLQVLASLGISSRPVPAEDVVDFLLGFIILVGGADGFSGLLSSARSGGDSQADSTPITVTGTLTLEPSESNRRAAAADR